MRYAFQLVNVFAERPFDGNPLCVFEDGRGLTDEHMLLLTRQFNLSETTFILPSDNDVAAARVRVFTPGYEMPFAGHPTLGTAHVIRGLGGSGDDMTLSFKSGRVPVHAEGDVWTLQPPMSGVPQLRAPDASAELIAGLLGLDVDDLAGEPCWVDTGADQLLVPVRDAAAVDRAAFDVSRLSAWPRSTLGRQTAYVFAMHDARLHPSGSGADAAVAPATVNGGDGQALEVYARYFFTTGGGVGEDPGTGSACANLGAWLAHRADRRGLTVRVTQGEKMGRPCRLWLTVDADGGIAVGGRVVPVGRGVVEF